MFKKSIVYAVFALILFQTASLKAQDYKTENIILVTLDGLRWQEVFRGVDSLLVNDTGMIKTPESLLEGFWNEDPLVRRGMLLPFLWNTIAEDGQLGQSCLRK